MESPHRLVGTLKDVLDVLGERKIAVCRELTKIHEEIFRGTLNQAISYFTQPRGEFTLIIEGAKQKKAEINKHTEMELRKLYQQRTTAKEAVTRLSQKSGVSKKELYQAWIKLKEGEG